MGLFVVELENLKFAEKLQFNILLSFPEQMPKKWRISGGDATQRFCKM